MKRIRFTEEQIIAVLREHEAGAKTPDLARKHGISEATLYNWKAIYGPPPSASVFFWFWTAWSASIYPACCWSLARPWP